MIEVKPDTPCSVCGHAHRVHRSHGCVSLYCTCRQYVPPTEETRTVTVTRTDALRILARAIMHACNAPTSGTPLHRAVLSLNKEARDDLWRIEQEIMGECPSAAEVAAAITRLKQAAPDPRWHIDSKSNGSDFLFGPGGWR